MVIQHAPKVLGSSTLPYFHELPCAAILAYQGLPQSLLMTDVVHGSSCQLSIQGWV